MDRQARGRWAEDAVANELTRRGYEILDRNVYLQRGELDLVAVHRGVLWFVECRSRGRRDRGAPHQSIDRRKKSALFAAAREYVHLGRYRGDYGFLAASVLPSASGGSPCIELTRLPIQPEGDDPPSFSHDPTGSRS